MKRNVLIIGAGGVGQVAAHKAAQNNDLLGDLHIASRTVSKCERVIASVHSKGAMKVEGVLEAHAVDAMDSTAVSALIGHTGAEIVINLSSAFVNMTVLDACIRTGAAYIDTAIHEDPMKICETPPWYANYEWKRREDCAKAGVTAILGAGFDPGVVNVYARIAADDYFDLIENIDIIDINAGTHGRWFATNFDPEINFREFTGQVWSWQNKQWVSNRMFEVSKNWDLPVVGNQRTFLTGHDEVHSISQILGVPNVRFWMGFSDHYVNVFTVLKNLGLLSEKPVTTAEGQVVIPLKVVKAVLPDPASLAPDYEGQTCIGTMVRGVWQGSRRELFIYNVTNHKAAFEEVGSQGISYTAGVPPVATAILVARGDWDVGRMSNIEELPPRPFLTLLDGMGLPTRIRDDR